ncbi:MAG: acyl carrier protein [Bacteroidales bacterium]|nr:acyl carrier protein [Bacteroidales bacterium]
MNIKESVIEIVANVCEIEKNQVTENSAIGDFPSWDSMAQLTIFSTIEDQLGVSFEPEEMMEIESISDMVNAIEAKK